MNGNAWWVGIALLALGAACGKTDSRAGDTDGAGGTGGTGGTGDPKLTARGGGGGSNGGSGGFGTAGGIGGSIIVADGGTAGFGGTKVSTGGSGGSGECVDGVRTIGRLEQRTLGVAALDTRTVVAVAQPARIDFFDGSLPDSSVTTPTISWTVEDLGFGEPDDFAAITAYGDALAILVSENAHVAHVIFRHPFGEPALPDAEHEMLYPRALVVGSNRFAIASTDGVFIAVLSDAEEWQWSGPFEREDRSVEPLAFVDDALLLGVSETWDILDGGAGGAGGAGSTDDPHARLELVSVEGETLWSVPSIGNPSVAVEVDGGWLIGETNSFWGSYQAALEWLDPDAESLATLSRVPVYSSGDGEDGAFGLALHGQTLYVANCESALLAGTWSKDQIELAPVAAYGESQYAQCSATQVDISEDLLVVGGTDTYLARLCSD